MKDELNAIDELRMYKWLLSIALEGTAYRIRIANLLFFCHHGKFPDEV